MYIRWNEASVILYDKGISWYELKKATIISAISINIKNKKLIAKYLTTVFIFISMHL